MIYDAPYKRAGLCLVEVRLSPGEGGDDPALSQAGHELRLELGAVQQSHLASP